MIADDVRDELKQMKKYFFVEFLKLTLNSKKSFPKTLSNFSVDKTSTQPPKDVKQNDLLAETFGHDLGTNCVMISFSKVIG